MPDDSTLIAAALDDRYVIEREIGAGGMAVVYLARDRKLDREVALKVLRPDLSAVIGAERFLKEIEVTANLQHPHILPLFDSGDAAGQLYYVMPYVDGETLRARLDREKQLPIDDAIRIASEVAAALEYAHRHRVVHRDIKPENILLHDGAALVADFGIALAVQDAGGARLTQTGISLGTPQYMAPEQATGDRGIDQRSDVYSLAAVLYEMIAGEPPVTGATSQSMIAKLMTENPTHLRVLRNTVSPELDAAVAKGLSKTPADRFSSAGEFARALRGQAASSAMSAPARRTFNRRSQLAGAVVVLGAVAALAASAMRAHAPGPATLGQKTQLTTTGAMWFPAISPDGKQLAFASRHCSTGPCTYTIELQDVGGTTTRTILDDVSATYSLEWSPDRRNLIMAGTVHGRYGAFLLSALGGAPRYLAANVAAFYAGGDSLLLGPATPHPDSVFYVRVAALDGIPRDSIRIAGPGSSLDAISVVPGTSWILTLVVQRPHGLWQIVDRSGKVADQVVNACTCGGLASRDAVWLVRVGEGFDHAVVRIAIDRANGRFAARQDTMTRGVFSAFSLTADGTGMVIDEGTVELSVWAVPFADATRGIMPVERRLVHTSGDVRGSVSPDGRSILVWRAIPTAGGHFEPRYSVIPFDGGAETPLPVPGMPVRAQWTDSQQVGAVLRTSAGSRLAEVDVHSGAQRNVVDVADTLFVDATALPQGWAWIPGSRDRLVVLRAGKRREYPIPSWFSSVNTLSMDRAHNRLLYAGFDRATGDSVGVAALSLDDGKQELWAAHAAYTRYDEARVRPAVGHGAVLTLGESLESWSAFAIDGPGKITPLGTVARPAWGLNLSSDLTRAAVVQLDYRADAWLNNVVVH